MYIRPHYTGQQVVLHWRDLYLSSEYLRRHKRQLTEHHCQISVVFSYFFQVPSSILYLIQENMYTSCFVVNNFAFSVKNKAIFGMLNAL